MKKRLTALALLGVLLLSAAGCSLLERGYGTVEPHSSSYYESEAQDVLRAENYQDLVNDLLVLISGAAPEGTIWLYPGSEELDPEQAVENACQEVQRETPMGAYAVEFITYAVSQDDRSYSEIKLEIGYRRTEAQIRGIVHTTSVSALHSLLTAAAERDAVELVVQIGYFQEQAEEVQTIVAQVQEEQDVDPEQPWQVVFYPNEISAGIIEILMKN